MNKIQEDRVVCSNCQRKIIPRLTFENGEPAASWCTFCGTKVEDFYYGWEFGAGMIILAGVAVYWFW